MVVFDKDGCGRDNFSREEVEQEVEENLGKNGWEGNACAIVVAPEIENWVWVHASHIQNIISWKFSNDIYDWLHTEGLKDPQQIKPTRPKEALEAALRKNRTPRSSSIYEDIAASASYRKCIDPAFIKMLDQLKIWFP